MPGAYAQSTQKSAGACDGSKLCRDVKAVVLNQIISDAASLSKSLTAEERLNAIQDIVAQKMEFIMDRFGYGFSPANPELSLTSPGEDNLSALIFNLTSAIENTKQFL